MCSFYALLYFDDAVHSEVIRFKFVQTLKRKCVGLSAFVALQDSLQHRNLLYSLQTAGCY